MSEISGKTVTQTVTLGSSNNYPTYANPLTIASDGAVDVSTGGAVYGPHTGAWSVYNFGTLAGSAGDGIKLKAGGTVGNQAGGVIEGSNAGVEGFTSAVTLTNSGGIYGTVAGGVQLFAGGDVTNTGTGLIQGGHDGVYIGGTSGFVTNAATIVGNGGTGFAGVRLEGGGTVIDTGTIMGNGTAGYGVLLGSAGYLRNSGLIEGYHGVEIRGTGGTVVNLGTIEATDGVNSIAVEVYGSGTVIDSGTILASQTSRIAIAFENPLYTTVGVRLVLDPGYVIQGNILANNFAYNTLELAVGDGTFSGLGRGFGASARFYNFYNVTLDAGAHWNLTGYNLLDGANYHSVTHGITITGAGTLTNTGTIKSQTIYTQTGQPYGHLYLGAGTLANSGYIGAGQHKETSGTLQEGGVLTVENGGYLTNLASGTIAGFGRAVDVGNGSGTIVNGGLIKALGAGLVGGPIGGLGILSDANGVIIDNRGTITASVTTGQGIRLLLGGSVGNSGLIIADAFGISDATDTATITNSGTIITTGTAGIGLDLAGGGTVIDSGTIIGAGGTAGLLSGTGNLLELQPGYKLVGNVAGGSGSTLELGGSSGNALTVNYNGLGLGGFTDVLFGSGGHDTLDVSNTSGTLPVTISGFSQTSETIDLTSIGTNGTISSQTAGSITVTGSLGSVTMLLDGTDGALFTTHSDGGTGTDLSPACFRRGTLILTDRGEVPIEELNAGDRMITISGEAPPIRWIGRRSYDGRFVAGNHGVLPIRISAGACADGLPARDLWVSPGHAMLLDDLLVPAEYLINGATIVQEEHVESLEYLHIELDAHAILIAEGAPSESYIDCDNRLMFANGREYAELFPEDARPRWAYCAPRLDWESPELVAIRARLIDRATALGHPLTLDPDLHLAADGVAIQPQAITGTCYRFEVPSGSASLSLASRRVIPAGVDPCSRDRRVLGVPVERISLYDADFLIEASHNHTALCDGFHADEGSHRWTDGLAHLPDWWTRGFAGAFTLEIRLAPSDLPYRLAAATTPEALAR